MRGVPAITPGMRDSICVVGGKAAGIAVRDDYPHAPLSSAIGRVRSELGYDRTCRRHRGAAYRRRHAGQQRRLAELARRQRIPCGARQVDGAQALMEHREGWRFECSGFGNRAAQAARSPARRFRGFGRGVVRSGRDALHRRQTVYPRRHLGAAIAPNRPLGAAGIRLVGGRGEGEPYLRRRGRVFSTPNAR